jgi:hypothetical protein
MACAIDATAGGPTANSYVSIADATAFHETQPYPEAWADADADQRCRALQTATRLLNRWWCWYGQVTSEDQALLWPRTGVTGPNGFEIPDDEIPTEIEEATAELARLLLVSDVREDNPLGALGIKRLKAGPVEIEARDVSAKVLSDDLVALLSAFGQPCGRTTGTVSIYRA